MSASLKRQLNALKLEVQAAKRAEERRANPDIVTLPIDLKNGNNGRGTAFWPSHKRRQQFENIIRATGNMRTPPNYPQRVTYTRILGKGQRRFDPGSIGRGDAKELEDALTACGWWHDDSARWITTVDYRQDATRRREGPAVEITVEAA